MGTPDQILEQMDAILNRLLQNAERLQGISHQVIEKEELMTLQKNQEIFVKELMTLDAAFKKAYKANPPKKESPLRASIDKKLKKFEELNKNFIENINASHGILKLNKPPKP